MVVVVETSSLDIIHEDDIYEHIFNVYTDRPPPEDLLLGYIDRHANEIEISLPAAQISFTIQQSLSELSGNGSTTGFLVWKTSQWVLDWILTDPNCPLFKVFLHKSDAIVYELGTGVAGLLVATLGTRCQRYVVTDQKHLLKLLKENFTNNVQSNRYISTTLNSPEEGLRTNVKLVKKGRPSANKLKKTTIPSSQEVDPNEHEARIDFIEYDWEHLEKGLMEVKNLLNLENTRNKSHSGEEGVQQLEYPDIIFGIDTNYNEYLVSHFLAGAKQLMEPDHTVLVVAMQLRDESVLETFLEETLTQGLTIYLVPDKLLSEDLKRGFAVYFIKLET